MNYLQFHMDKEKLVSSGVTEAEFNFSYHQQGTWDLYVYTSLRGLLQGDQSSGNGCVLSLRTNAFVKKAVSDCLSL